MMYLIFIVGDLAFMRWNICVLNENPQCSLNLALAAFSGFALAACLVMYCIGTLAAPVRRAELLPAGISGRSAASSSLRFRQAPAPRRLASHSPVYSRAGKAYLIARANAQNSSRAFYGR